MSLSQVYKFVFSFSFLTFSRVYFLPSFRRKLNLALTLVHDVELYGGLLVVAMSE